MTTRFSLGAVKALVMVTLSGSFKSRETRPRENGRRGVGGRPAPAAARAPSRAARRRDQRQAPVRIRRRRLVQRRCLRPAHGRVRLDRPVSVRLLVIGFIHRVSLQLRSWDCSTGVAAVGHDSPRPAAAAAAAAPWPVPGRRAQRATAAGRPGGPGQRRSAESRPARGTKEMIGPISLRRHAISSVGQCLAVRAATRNHERAMSGQRCTRGEILWTLEATRSDLS